MGTKGLGDTLKRDRHTQISNSYWHFAFLKCELSSGLPSLNLCDAWLMHNLQRRALYVRLRFVAI